MEVRSTIHPIPTACSKKKKNLSIPLELTYKIIYEQKLLSKHSNQLKHGDQNDSCEGFETLFDHLMTDSEVQKCKLT